LILVDINFLIMVGANNGCLNENESKRKLDFSGFKAILFSSKSESFSNAASTTGILSKVSFPFVALFTLFLCAGTLQAATVTTTGSGNWSSVVPNAPWPGGIIPAVGDDIIVGDGFTLTVNGARTCNSITLGNGSILTINAAFTVTTNLLVNDGGTVNVNNTILVNGTTTVGNGGGVSTISFPVATGTKTFVGLVTIAANAIWSNTIAEAFIFRGGIANNGTFTASTGVHTFEINSQSLTGTFSILSITVTAITLTNNNTLTVGTALSGSGGLTQASGATLNIGGASAITTLTATVNPNTVNYVGAGAQTIKSTTYHHLTTSGGGTKTAGVTTVNGDLSIGDGTTFAATNTILVTGATNVGGGTSGAISFAVLNTKTFTGLVTIANGATWSNGINEAVTLRGGITNNGTFTAGTGVYTFDTNPQTLFSSSPISIANVTVTGVVLTNNSQLTVATALSGVGGTLRQGANATLNIGTASAITTIDATTNSPNTVNYTGAAQTVKNVNYVNLGLSGSGIKTLAVGTTSIAGNLDLLGTVSTTGVVGLTIGGNVNIGVGTTFTSGAFTHSVAGSWTNNGTFTAGTGTVNFNGAAQNISGGSTTFNNLILSGSGTKTLGASPTTTISGTLTVSNGVVASLSNANTYTANSLILGGVSQLSGTWGNSSSSPAATYQNNTFLSGTGRVTVASGLTYYSRISGAWNNSITWSTVGFGSPTNIGTFPQAGDIVIIGGGFNVTLTGPQTSGSLSFDPGTSVTNTLDLSGNTLTISGAVTIPQINTSGANILAVGSGTLNAGSISFTNGSAGGTGHRLTISTGTTTVSGNVTGTGNSSTIQFTGPGLLRLGGTLYTAALGFLNTGGFGTVEYNAPGAQTVQAHVYQNLTLSGGGNKTLAAAATISGNLSIGDATTFSVGGVGLTVTGTTTVGGGTSGTLAFVTSNAGAKNFIGLVTIAAGGSWINNTINEAVTFQGGIVNNGTFTSGTAVQTFNTTAAQALTGTLSIPSITVNAPTVLTNNGTLTVATALAGTGNLTQGASSTLNIGGTSAITALDATTNVNTVNYTSAAQTIRSNSYHNLTLSGSGVTVLQAGTTTIGGDLNLSGAVNVTGVIGLTISGDLNIGASATFNAGSFTHNVEGLWTNNGIFNHNSGAIILNGAGQTISGVSTTFYDLTLSGSGTKVFGSNTTILNGFSINTGVVADLGVFTSHTALRLTLGGVLQSTTGIWGGTASNSPPASTNDTFFLSTSVGEISVASGGNNFYSVMDGNWNSPAIWSTTGFGGTGGLSGIPGPNDFVFIGRVGPGVRNVNVDIAASCSALTFDAGTSVTNTLTINPTFSLAVSGGVTIPRTATGGSNILAVATGSLTAGDIDFTVPGNTGGQLVSITTGTVTVSGNVTGIGGSSTIQFTGGAGKLNLGGAIYTPLLGTLTTVAASTVEYNGTGSQTVQGFTYGNLILSGGNTKNLSAATTISGNLSIADATTFTVGGFNLTVTGTTTVGGGTSGTLSFITSNAGAKTFAGLVTIVAGGSWNNTINEAVTFQGGITNTLPNLAVAFNAGTAVQTFSTTQTLDGAFSIPNVTASNVLTNLGTLTVGTALAGGGTLLQGASATLNIGGTSAISALNATVGSNTVNYTGAAQTVNAGNYVNLGLSGSGIKTLQVGTTTITGNFALAGTASTTGVVGLTIGGNVDIGTGTSFTAGNFVHNVAGNWTKTGTGAFTNSGGTINLNGIGQSILGVSTTFSDLILSGTGTKVFGVTTFVNGGLFISNTSAKADFNGNTAHTANTLALGGMAQAGGTWGFTGSGATNIDANYFSNAGFITIFANSNNYYSRASADWNLNTTWSNVGFGDLTSPPSPPGANDLVFIGGGHAVTVTGSESCSALSFDASGTNSLTISGTLGVSGAVTIPRAVGGLNTLAVGAGTLTAGELDFTTSASGGHEMTISTGGTATISGNVTGIGTSSTISFSGGGSLRLGGLFYTPALGTLTTNGVGTVEYIGASAQTVQAHNYRNLTLSGGGTKTLNAATTIGGILSIANSTTFNVGAFPLTVTGATNVGGGASGNLTISSAVGAKTFTGLVTINTGATWNNSGNAPVTIRGGITNSGTFTAGTGVYTFDANTPVLTGLLTIPSVTVTGITLTNNGTLTTNTALAGVGGTLLQGTNAILNIGGTSAVTNLDATTNNNTVNYTGAAQTVKNVNYRNLGLSGSGIKTLQTPIPTTSIAGNLTLSGTVSTTGVVGLTIGGNMTIGAGTTFTAGAFTHNVAGNWVNNGTFNNSNATIVFNGGASAQTVSGTSNTLFNNITVNNTGGLTLSSPQRLNGLLSFGAGTVFNANGNLTLLSTAVNHAASIGNLTGVTFNGNVTVQRFFGAADNTDRFISSPISNATVAQLQAATPSGNFPVTGGFTGTSFPCVGCTNDGHNVRYYREAETGNINSGYKSWITSTASTLVPGVGYDAYMWNGTSATTVNFTGAINQGDINLGIVSGTPPNSTSITRTSNSQPTADGWNLVGNPYPSSIFWDSSVPTGWTSSNIDSYIWIYDVVGSNWLFKDYNNSQPATLPGGLIASGQGFWVYATAPTATLTVREPAKSTSTSTSYYRTSSEPVARLKISMAVTSSSKEEIYLMPKSSTSNRNARDVLKPELGIEPVALSFIVNSSKYAFYTNKQDDQAIPLYLKTKSLGKHEFTFTTEGNIQELEDYYLVDTYLGKFEKVTSGATYTFDLTAAQAETRSSRFFLTSNPELLLEGTKKVVQVSCFPNPTVGEMSIEINSEDVQNVSIINSTGISFQGPIDLKSSNGITSGKVDLSNLSPGMYLIRGYSKGKVFTEKVIKY
jgi:Secretion system C-terminal sorting domain